MSNARNSTTKLKNAISVMEHGAVPGIDCTAAITAAGAAVFAAGGGEVVFPQGAWVINATPTVPVGVQLRAQPGATFSGAGASALGFAAVNPATETRINYSTDDTDYAGFYLFRNADHTGGTPGFVDSNLLVRTVAGANVANFEWVVTAILDNYTPGTPEQVAIYAQANRRADGRTWGIAIENRDHTGNANPTAGQVGLEVGLFANGADTNTQRIGIDIVGGKGIVGATANIAYGLRIGPFNSDPTNCNFVTGQYLYGSMDRAIQISLSTGAVGIDLSGSTLTSSAIRLAQGQDIAFEATSARKLAYDGTGLGWFDGANLRIRLNADGSFGITDGIAEPATVAGLAQLFVDTADGDLKVKFGDGTVKTIVTDT